MRTADLVIEDLASTLVSAEAGLVQYRLLALAAIERARDLTIENDKLHAQLQHLREEIRTLVCAGREVTAARVRRAA